MTQAFQDYFQWHTRKRYKEITRMWHKRTFAYFRKVASDLVDEEIVHEEGLINNLESFSRENVIKFIHYLADKEEQIEATTILTYLRSLKAFYNWMKRQKPKENAKAVNKYFLSGLPHDSFENIRDEIPEGGIKEAKHLEQDQIRSITEKIARYRKSENEFIVLRNRAIFLTYFYTGIRFGELFDLKIEDVNLDSFEIKVRRKKTKSITIIDINERFYYHIRRYILYINNKGIKSGYLFFTEKKGSVKPISDKQVKRARKELCDWLKSKHGINEFNFQNMRHSFATHLLHSGADIETVRDYMGHTSVKTTQNYIHRVKNGGRSTISKLPY